MDLALLLFFTIIIIVGAIILVVIVARGKTTSVLNVDKFRSDWLKIEQSLQKGESSSYQLAILNADKLLDNALKQRGCKGQTMGERMKSCQDMWSNANGVWGAHKVRNRIAHEADVVVSYDEARRVLAGFKQGLKDVGAI